MMAPLGDDKGGGRQVIMTGASSSDDGERLEGAGRDADLALAWFEAKNFEGQGEERKGVKEGLL